MLIKSLKTPFYVKFQFLNLMVIKLNGYQIDNIVGGPVLYLIIFLNLQFLGCQKWNMVFYITILIVELQLLITIII